jgi:rod shape-determining protein MreC
MALSRPRGSRGSRTRLTVLVLASVSLLAVGERGDAGDSVVHDLREGAATVFDPFERAAEVVSRPLRAGWDGLVHYSDLQDREDEIERLEDELARVEAESISEQDAARQLEELSEAVDLPWAGDIDSIAARVTSGPESNFSHAVEINRGSDHGVAVGMPVVANGGLVGRVVQVRSGTSSVSLITDPDSRVGVRLAETGALGTARGQGRDEPLVVDSSIEPDAEVVEGSGLVTSGVDRSVYPDAIPVARVASTRRGAGGLSLELVAEPLVEFDRLNYVSVLLWEPPA